MTTDQLTAIRRDVEAAIALRELATTGPWKAAGALGEFVSDEHHMAICRMNETICFRPDGKSHSNGAYSHRDNTAFIAHARTDPTHNHALALLDEIQRLHDTLQRITNEAYNLPNKCECVGKQACSCCEILHLLGEAGFKPVTKEQDDDTKR